jgi:gamma-glutamyltranspeptidase/glutathione hydrolase
VRGKNRTVSARHGVVASSSDLASEAGVEILKKGGNAVDAACATALALAVTHPAAGNLGGGGFMLIRLANGKSTAIDYRETAPALATRDMYLDKAGNLVPSSSLVGYRAAGVPGTPAGLAMAHAKYGKLKWKEVVEPAILLAERGFIVSKSLARGLRGTKMLAQFEESRRIFQNGGAFYKEGDLFKQPELAATLRRLQSEGPRDFYQGRTAQLIAADQKAHAGLITLEDLKNYRAVEREPLRGSYRGYDLITMPPPSSGGVALLEMFRILERYDLAAIKSDTVRTDHLLIETMRRAFADRAEFAGDPDFVKVPVDALTSKRYADEVASTIDLEKATPSAQIGHGKPLAYESPETTHFSVVDSAGNAVSNTYTLNMGFGCGVTVKGAGFLLNDEMDDFAAKPGAPNGFGLIQGEANAIAPHKRPLSSMTPTFLLKNGRLQAVIGSPGGPTIITTVLQTLIHLIDHGMSLRQAIAAPRLHHQWMPDEVRIERGALSEADRKRLEAMGHIFPARAAEGWGDAEGIQWDAATRRWIGVTDPRSPDAGAVGY